LICNINFYLTVSSTWCSGSNCADGFDVTLKKTYDDNTGTVEGEIDVCPRRVPDYGPPNAFSGGYTSTGTDRRTARDDEADEE
jgi:hypothetical protein